MDIILIAVLAVPGVVLGFLAAYDAFFAVASLPSLWRGSPDRGGHRARTRFVIVVPAHDEAKLIAGAVKSLLDADYPAAQRDVVVVADNCSDETAALARQAGAICHERHDLERRGKPYALQWVIERLDLSRYDALVIVDSDTVVDRAFYRALDWHLCRGAAALQGYFGVMNPDETWLTRLGTLPATLKFRLHFPGKHAFRLSCPLAGNGMCFAIEIIRRFGWNAFSLTENWEYYANLTLNGYVVGPAVDAVIYSQVAKNLKLGETQRVRWMRGRNDTVRRYWRALVGGGTSGRRLLTLDALIEIARPSHALLLFWSLLYAAVCVFAWWWGWPGAAALLWLAAVTVGLQVGYLFAGLAVERPPLRTWLALALVPWYLLWKVVISLKGMAQLSDRGWIKTTRN
jgi:cellulose synthase/poly-beta-1,6-N-acetylglucosamine synthase-like glycosyltransferase